MGSLPAPLLLPLFREHCLSALSWIILLHCSSSLPLKKCLLQWHNIIFSLLLLLLQKGPPIPPVVGISYASKFFHLDSFGLLFLQARILAQMDAGISLHPLLWICHNATRDAFNRVPWTIFHFQFIYFLCFGPPGHRSLSGGASIESGGLTGNAIESAVGSWRYLLRRISLRKGVVIGHIRSLVTDPSFYRS